MKVWEQSTIHRLARELIQYCPTVYDENILFSHDKVKFSTMAEAMEHEINLLMEDVEEKPNPISASDYEKLKAIYLLFGDCYVAMDMDNQVAAYSCTPKKDDFYWCGNVIFGLYAGINCLSWQDEKPLHLTERWLKEVEHG